MVEALVVLVGRGPGGRRGGPDGGNAGGFKQKGGKWQIYFDRILRATNPSRGLSL
jgi:hypothetical protein